MRLLTRTMVFTTILFLIFFCKAYAKNENCLYFTIGIKESFFSENQKTKKVNLNENRKIQPGESGYFDIEINLENYYSNINYIIEFSNLKNKPKNLEFIVDNKIVNLENLEITGIQRKNTTKELKRIYWKWEYEGEDCPPIDKDEITFDISLNWEKEKNDFIKEKLPRTGSDLLTYISFLMIAIGFSFIKLKH